MSCELLFCRKEVMLRRLWDYLRRWIVQNGGVSVPGQMEFQTTDDLSFLGTT